MRTALWTLVAACAALFAAPVRAEHIPLGGPEGAAGIIRCFGYRPDFQEAVMAFSALHFSPGHLSVREKEMIATYVSGLNQCPY